MGEGTGQPAEDARINAWVERVPEIDPLAEGVVERVHLVSAYLENACAKIAAPHGINLRDYDILARLYWIGSPHRLTPTQLAIGTRTPTTSITSRLDRLERLGLLRRTPSPDDRRSLLAELTAEGQDLFRSLVVEQAALERDIFHQLRTADLNRLRDLLEEVMAACELRLGPPPRLVDTTLAARNPE